MNANVPAGCTAPHTCRMIFEYVPLRRAQTPRERETKKMVSASAEKWRSNYTPCVPFRVTLSGGEGTKAVELGKHRSVAEVPPPFTKMSPRTMARETFALRIFSCANVTSVGIISYFRARGGSLMFAGGRKLCAFPGCSSELFHVTCTHMTYEV